MDATSYLLGKKSGGSTPIIINSLVEVNNALDDYYDYLNGLPSSYETITSDDVVLYTPNQNYKTYFIAYNGGAYKIYWVKTGGGITKSSSGTSANSFLLTIKSATGDLDYGSSMIDMYKDNSIMGYNTLEEAITAIKSNATSYTNITNYIAISGNKDIVTNGFAINTTTNETITCKKISQNETIQTI